MGTQAPSALLELRLHAIRYEGEGIHSFDFRDRGGAPLPAFTAGAHVDVHLPNGMVRQYSLCNPQDERHRYVVGVKRDDAGRGGSRLLHEKVHVGDVLRVSEPRNHFGLVEGAPHSVLLAGGIGITPMVCMARRLAALGRPFELHHAVRRRSEAAFAQALAGIDRRLHVDEEHGGRPLALAPLLAQAPAGTHFYCCGPAPMLDAFEDAATGLPAQQVHVERFSAAHEADHSGGFVVRLARSGASVEVRPGQTILEALRTFGVDVPASCEQGICGSCETRVLDGTPEHRDSLLSDEEKASNSVMMVCCSGSRGPELVLDL